MRETWLVLDAMGVVFEVADDTNDLLIPYVRKLNRAISAEKIAELYVQASLGRVSSFGFWEALGFGDAYPEIERDYLDACVRIDPEFIGIAERLSREFSLALLSNDVKEWSAHLRARFDLDRLFKAMVISGEVGYRKPDKRIYGILLDRIRSAPSDCVFVDDRARNLRPASEMGIKTIRFVRESSDDDFAADFEVRAFRELPQAVATVLERARTPE